MERSYGKIQHLRRGRRLRRSRDRHLPGGARPQRRLRGLGPPQAQGPARQESPHLRTRPGQTREKGPRQEPFSQNR